MAFKLTVDGRAHEVEIVRRRPHLVVRIDGREHEVSLAGDIGDGRQTIEIAGLPVHFARAACRRRARSSASTGRTFEAGLVDPRAEAGAGGGGAGSRQGADAGRRRLGAQGGGDAVKRGETIVTIESMKLQTALVAPRDGVIAELLARKARPSRRTK